MLARGSLGVDMQVIGSCGVDMLARGSLAVDMLEVALELICWRLPWS